MDKYADCIIAHSNPQTLATLISQIDSPRNDICLHVDKKDDINRLLRQIVINESKLEILTDRINVKCGGDCQLRCELSLFKAALNGGTYPYIHLLFGQGLLIEPESIIRKFLDVLIGKWGIHINGKNIIAMN